MTVSVIAGPTAIGKSFLSVILSKETDSAVLSADVYQSYKLLNIGSAKVTEAEKDGVEHFMIDRYDVDYPLTVSDFITDALSIINDRESNGKNTVICGGSGLYIDSLLYDSYSMGEDSVSDTIKNELNDFLLNNGKDKLFERLTQIDPEYSQITHPNNVKRVLRALEYYYSSGKKMSQNANKERSYRFKDTKYYCLVPFDREVLYDRINLRVDKMIDEGLVDEVRDIYSNYHNRELNSLQGIGYKEIIEYLENEISLEEAIYRIKLNSRHYAKRQLTWFRNNPDVKQIQIKEYSIEEYEKIKEGIIKNEF